MGTDDLDWAARWLIYHNLDFDVLEPPELTRHIHDLGLWLTHCHSPRTVGPRVPDRVRQSNGRAPATTRTRGTR
ncbi:MAG: hypothetical protein WBP28_01380 [Nostocoides sp.]